jgi:hypothetical protein
MAGVAIRGGLLRSQRIKHGICVSLTRPGFLVNQRHDSAKGLVR